MKHYSVPVTDEVLRAIAVIAFYQRDAIQTLLVVEAAQSLVCQERLIQLANSYRVRV